MPDPRNEIEKLLPFYVNGTLDPDERARVEDSLEEDAALREELALLRAIRSGVKGSASAAAPGELGLRRLLRDVRRGRRRERLAAWRPALAAAAALVLVLQAVVIVRLASEAEPGSRLLGAGGLAGEGVTLQVGFAEGASESEIRELLLSEGVEIVAGPSALGLYRLRVEPPPADEAALESLLERLRARDTVVSFAGREPE